MYRTLISTDTLAENLSDTRWRVIDCRFDLSDTAAGHRAWQGSHIPGAIHAHLERDLSAPVTAESGRHPLPNADELARRFSAWGIDAVTQVVAYDADGGAMAARLWWLLRWLGHEAAAVLDGGWQAWIARGLPIDSTVPVPARAHYPRRAALAVPVDSAGVERAVDGEADWRLIDARAQERFRGEVEPIDAVGGHIPGALNRPFADNLKADGSFLMPEILRERFQAASAGRADRVVHYCGSGVTACHNVLAMEHAGLSGSRLYAGSWSEWIRHPQRPIAKGA